MIMAGALPRCSFILMRGEGGGNGRVRAGVQKVEIMRKVLCLVAIMGLVSPAVRFTDRSRG